MWTKSEIDRALRLKNSKEKWSPDHTLIILAIVQHSCANKPATFNMKETSGVPIRTSERRLLNMKWPFTQLTPPLFPLPTPSTYQTTLDYLRYPGTTRLHTPLPHPFLAQHFKNKNSCRASSVGSRRCKQQMTVLWIQCGKIYNLRNLW